MLYTPKSKIAERHDILINSTIWTLGPEYLALWMLLSINAELEQDRDVYTCCTDTAELGRNMAGPIVDRMKIMRMLHKLAGIDAIALVTSKSGCRITINYDMNA